MVSTKEVRQCSELSWKEHGQQIKRPYCVLLWGAGELCCGMLPSPFISFALWPVLETRKENEEGSARGARELEHMCYRERRRKPGLFGLRLRSHLRENYGSLGDSNKGGAVKLFWVIPDKTIPPDCGFRGSN